MDERVIDIYEKYTNLFKLKISPPIKKLYQVQPHEVSKYPIVQRYGRDEQFSIVKKEGSLEHPLISRVVKDVIRNLVCKQVEGIPAFQVNSLKTKIINKRTALKKYGDKVVIIFPGCNFRIINIGNELYLCIDYTVLVKNYLRASEIKQLLPNFRFDLNRGYYEDKTEWKPARIEDVKDQEAHVLTREGSITVPSSKFLPDIPATKISKLLARKGIQVDFDREIKRLSLLTVDNAPKQRLQKNVDFAQELKKNLFPIKVGEFEIDLDTNPVRLMPPNFDVRTDLTEPFSSFDHEDETKRSQIILDGLTEFGSYEKPKTELKIVILTTKDQSGAINSLIDRIENGADRYKGMGKTFGTTMKIMEILVTDDTSGYVDRCKEFIRRKDFTEADIFLVYMPEEEGKASYDSPYYEVKKLLTNNGIPSQMVDEETLRNPRFKDLNLALNIFAKAGYTPWVLDEELQDVDLFIGLSYSSIKRLGRIERMMAYVNVFDKYGRWKFYQGDVEAFPFEERHKHYREIVKASIDKYNAENPGQGIRKIQVHYTQKIRKNDMQVINEQINKLIPGCQVFFVYINTNMPIRLFDKTTKDGSIERASYVVISRNQFFMATTGDNIFNQRGMGTPRILNITVQNLQNSEEVDLRTVAQHILSLTRLNWASTKSFCHEPITTKYAGDISYLMNVFMKDSNFSVSERLRDKPWFL